jgi:hypothetical protein
MSEALGFKVQLVYKNTGDTGGVPDTVFSDSITVPLAPGEPYLGFKTLLDTFREFVRYLEISRHVTVTSLYHPVSHELVGKGDYFTKAALLRSARDASGNPVVVLEVNHELGKPADVCGNAPFKIKISSPYTSVPVFTTVRADSGGYITFKHIVAGLHEYVQAAESKGLVVAALRCIKPVMHMLYPHDIGIECTRLIPYPGEGNEFTAVLMRADASVHAPAPAWEPSAAMGEYGGRTSSRLGGFGSFGGRSGQSRRRSRSRGGRNGRVRSRSRSRGRGRGGARSRSRAGRKRA